MTVRERIGTLADRLASRLGRSMDACRTCGKPTRSHVVGNGRQCHTCHVDGERVLAADGGHDACETVGCDGTPIENGHCEECISTSPKHVDDPDRVGEAVNPAGRSSETTDSSDTPKESVEEADYRGANPGVEAGRSVSPDGDSAGGDDPALEAFADADFTDPETGIYSTNHTEREQWMGGAGDGGKQPFSPWADRDHPEADPDEDARWKWGLAENHVDSETIAIAEDDHRLDGRTFIQKADSPNAYIDGDNVLDPETGEPHPAFLAVIDRLGLSYADVSQSGGGAHVQYLGELPEGVKQAAWQLDDEPWGDHDENDLPSVEIYDGKRVYAATGKHVPGTPTEACEWDDDALREILGENDQLPDPGARHAGDREAFDLGVAFPDGFLGEVMRAMTRVPYGETRTYGELAAGIGSSPVAVGGACGRNPVPVVVPCHRIVAAGSLGGYSAAGGVAAKRALLDAEAGQTGLGDWGD